MCIGDRLGVGQAEANRLRHEYWRDHGTTLAGLMRLHGVEPGPYLDRVHEIDLTHLERDAALAEGIRALPGLPKRFGGLLDFARLPVVARGRIIIA